MSHATPAARLDDAQRELAASVLHLAKWVAARYCSRSPDTFDDALDGAIHAVRSYVPGRGKFSSWVKRNASLYVTRRKPGFWRRCVVHLDPAAYDDATAHDDDGLRAVDLRDEVSLHLRRATPWQRRAMLSILRGESPYVGRSVAMSEYRKSMARRTSRGHSTTAASNASKGDV